MQQSDMDFIEDRPDVRSPVYFVDPVSGSDSTGTGDFNTPWKTVNKAITGNRITHGARVMITRRCFHEAAANLAWAAHADNPGETGQPVTISGTGRDTCILNYLTPASSNTIYRPDANNQLEIEHLTARIPATSTCASWSYTSTTTGSFTVKDAILEAFDNGGLVGPGIYIRGGNIRLVRSKLVAPAEHATFTGFTWDGTEVTYCASEIYPSAYPNPWASATNHLREPLNSDEEGRPQSRTSALMRLGSPLADNMWDYYRRPIRNPVVGAFAYSDASPA
jgi:hypothetical protein